MQQVIIELVGELPTRKVLATKSVFIDDKGDLLTLANDLLTKNPGITQIRAIGAGGITAYSHLRK